VPRLLVPDNLKSGVTKASFYDPELNRTYGSMAAHYGVGILPARPRKPKDKAAVEAGVRFAQGYILGRLRHLTFFSLAECNACVFRRKAAGDSDASQPVNPTQASHPFRGKAATPERV
jgi:transposase